MNNGHTKIDYLITIYQQLRGPNGFTARDLQYAMNNEMGIAACIFVLKKLQRGRGFVKQSENKIRLLPSRAVTYRYWMTDWGISYLQVKGIIDEEGNVIQKPI